MFKKLKDKDLLFRINLHCCSVRNLNKEIGKKNFLAGKNIEETISEVEYVITKLIEEGFLCLKN